MQPLVPDRPDVEVARGTRSEVTAAAAGLGLLAGVRASTRDAVVGELDAAVAGGDEGPFAAVGVGDGTGVMLGVRADGADRWVLTRRPVVVPADRCALARLRRGVSGLVAHALRSPLVRVQGAVTLAQRAWSRDRDDQLDHELRRLAAVTAEALAGADEHADAIRRLAADSGVVAAGEEGTGATELVSVPDPAALTDRLAPAVAGRQTAPAAHDPLGVDGPTVAVVVVPQLDAVPVVGLQRQIAHLCATPSVAGIHLLVPGTATTWPAGVLVDEDAQPLRMDGDAEADLASARAWMQTADDEPVTALAELVTLRRSGVRIVLLPPRRAEVGGSGSREAVARGWGGLSLPAARLARVARDTAAWPVLLDGGIEAVVFGSGSTAVGSAGADVTTT